MPTYPTVAPGGTLTSPPTPGASGVGPPSAENWTIDVPGGVVSQASPGSWTLSFDGTDFVIGVPLAAAAGTYRATYNDASGNFSRVFFTVSNPPAVPTGLAATAGNAQVGLAWTASTGATSYPVERAPASGGPWTQIGNAGTNAYTDFSAVNGTLYFYRVRATGTGGTSGPSSVVSATPTGGGGGGGIPAFANLWAAGDAPADADFAAAPNLVDNAADDAVTGYDGE